MLAKILGYTRHTVLGFVKDGRLKPLKNCNPGKRKLWMKYYFDLDDPVIKELVANRHDPANDLRRVRRMRR